MEFTLNEEQEMLQKSARDFLKKECDKKRLAELEKSETGFSKKLWQGMADLGWMGMIVPEAHGGVGLSLVDLAVLFEEFGRAALNGPMLSSVTGTLAIVQGGSESLKERLLSRLASGEVILSFAMEEPEVAYEPRFVSAPAVRKGGGYAVGGTKMFIPYASVADELLVVTRTDGTAGEEKGITTFLVDGKAPGIRLTPLKTLGGDKLFQVDFEGVPVPPHNMVGDLNQGSNLVKSVVEKATGIQCAEMVGGAQYELEITAEYCRNRIQFGRAIGTFQAVQHRLADMYMDVLGARLTTYQAVWRHSEGLPATREVAIAKTFASNAVRRVAFSAQQLHAGMGYDLDHELHFYYRRAKALELRLGSVPVQLNVLGKELGL